AVGSSSPPRSCSSVVFPDPEAPTIAIRSPGATERSMPFSTSSVRPASWNVFTSPRATSTGRGSADGAGERCTASFMTQRLGRCLPRGGERGVERRGDREREREPADPRELVEAQPARKLAEPIHLGGQEIDAE